MVGSNEKNAVLCNIKDGKKIHKFPNSSDYNKGIYDLDDYEFYKKPDCSMAFSNNGNLCITFSNNNTACVWNTHTGSKISEFKRHMHKIVFAKFIRDSYICLTSSIDKAYVWNAETGKVICELKDYENHGSFKSADFSIDGKIFIAGYFDRQVILWNLSDGKKVYKCKKINDLDQIYFLSDNKSYLITSKYKGTAIIYDTQTQEIALKFRVSRKNRNLIDFSSDGTMCLTNSYDNHVILWNLKSKSEIYDMYFKSVIGLLKFSPDNKKFLISFYNGETIFYDTKTKEPIMKIRDYKIDIAFFSSNSKLCMICSEKDRVATICDIESRKIIRKIKNYTDELKSFVFSPNGNTYLTCSEKLNATLWDTKSGERIQEFISFTEYIADSYEIDEQKSKWCEGKICALAFSSNGNLCLTGSSFQSASIWNSVTGSKICELKGHEGDINAAVFSHDGKKCLTGSNSIFNSAIIWDVKTGKMLHILKAKDYVNTVAFSPNDKLCLTGLDHKTCIIWDVQTGEKVATLKDFKSKKYSSIISAVFLTNEECLTCTDKGKIIKWNIKNRKAISKNQTNKSVNHQIISPDFKFIAGYDSSGFDYDETVKIFNLNGDAIYDFYNITDICLKNCNFFNVNADDKTKEILRQQGAIIE